MLNKEAILQATDKTTKAVEVPEWGGTVYVHSMSGAEREQFETFVQSVTHNGKLAPNCHVRENLLVKTLCDESGVRLFDDGDVGALSEKNGKILDMLFNVSQSVCGMTEEAQEDATKN